MAVKNDVLHYGVINILRICGMELKPEREAAWSGRHEQLIEEKQKKKKKIVARSRKSINAHRRMRNQRAELILDKRG
ncbi:hypothetical protein CEXT_89191 [Caerostris extrusa]|uniref:Ribosomal protein S21 n=1 Tax=Caerostris extrusa TaxID=172846 RepID=A0AAV4T668_CAEEX|nr:hypothetical protein CEXT_89191 [Caerostris extrusa]